MSSQFGRVLDPLGLFSGSGGNVPQPQLPTINDPKIEAEKRRQLAARLSQGGRQATILTGGQGVQGSILGTAAQLSGGVV